MYPFGHCSPAAMIPTGVSSRSTYAATAERFRNEETRTSPNSAASIDRVAPFGEGRTIRVPGGILIIDFGESECAPFTSRISAIIAWCSSAKLWAVGPFQRYGNTIACRASAILTQVVNESTSTMMNVLHSVNA